MANGKLYLKNFKSKRLENGININIARGNISNVDLKLIELAPSKELFNWYINLKKSNSLYEGWFKDYRKVYLNQMKNNNKSLNALKTIKRMLEEGNDVAVYCFCEDVSKCHRSIIGDLFEKKGFEVIR